MDWLFKRKSRQRKHGQIAVCIFSHRKRFVGFKRIGSFLLCYLFNNLYKYQLCYVLSQWINEHFWPSATLDPYLDLWMKCHFSVPLLSTKLKISKCNFHYMNWICNWNKLIIQFVIGNMPSISTTALLSKIEEVTERIHLTNWCPSVNKGHLS